MRPIRLSGHARENMHFRGATEGEVIEAIRTVPWESAELGRLECRKDFIYGQEWNGKFYAINRFGLFLWKRMMRLWL